jgi:hypothetical protein
MLSRNGTVAPASTSAPPLSDLSGEVVRITPEMARQLLDHAVPNRPLSKSVVRRLIADLREGLWVCNGQPLLLGPNLELLDGRHRLQAVWEAGVTIETMVVCGVPLSLMPSIDQGRPRTGADLLAIHQREQPRHLAPAAQWVARYESDAMRQATAPLRPTELPRFIVDHPGLPGSLEWGRSIKALLPQAVASALYSVMSGIDAPLAKQYYHNLACGVGLTEDEPAHVIREKLLREKNPRTHLATVGRAALLVIGWTCVRKARPCPPGLRWRGLENPDVAFPAVQ